MSTFDGFVKEFPRIRIDRFRALKDHPPPLACFLSHVHSDHLDGLETLRSPFVYCSPATREILLRLEKWSDRVNFAKGLSETRKPTYRELSKLLKTIPLETATRIELSPGYDISITLFDANHCVGSCMFLIQDTGGTAILYSGDVRSEHWFVNSLIHNPLLIPFSLGPRRLDCLYLDTTFAVKDSIHQSFPSKAEGLRELLEQVDRFPDDTVFYFQSWTFGYENVWIALSAALNSQVHLDQYKWALYNSLALISETEFPEPREAAALCGFRCGNRHMPGCLTQDTSARIHSCERGAECDAVKTNPQIVRIVPIVTRTKAGTEVLEPGAGSIRVREGQPQTITFPYSRHSSYSELCELVAAFRPRDIHPCTVDETSWSEYVSMQALFGEFCSDRVFAHDKSMMASMSRSRHDNDMSQGSMRTHSDVDNNLGSIDYGDSQLTQSDVNDVEGVHKDVFYSAQSGPNESLSFRLHGRSIAAVESDDDASAQGPPQHLLAQAPHQGEFSQESSSSRPEPGVWRDNSIQGWAYDAAAGLNGMTWETFGGLECTKKEGSERIFQ